MRCQLYPVDWKISNLLNGMLSSQFLAAEDTSLFTPVIQSPYDLTDISDLAVDGGDALATWQWDLGIISKFF